MLARPVILSLKLILLCAQAKLSSQLADEAKDYALIVDCGSSGSRGHIFHWPHEVSPSMGSAFYLARKLGELEEASSPGKRLVMRIEPGLSTVLASSDEPLGAALKHLRPMMQFGLDNIPKERLASSSVYVIATAGLRLLQDQHGESILEAAAESLADEYPTFARVRARIITGSEEGFYQWLTINAHAKRLGLEFQQFNETLHCKSSLARRLGMLEMGGASTQVTFDLGSELGKALELRLKHSPGATESSIFEVNNLTQDPELKVRLFSTSFLGLGSDQARVLSTSHLLRNHVSAISRDALPDPCLPHGAQQSVLNGTNGRMMAKLAGLGNLNACRSLQRTVILRAKQDRLNCQLKIKKNIAQDWCPTSLLGLDYLPFREMQFVATGEFYYATKLANMSTFSLSGLEKSAAQLCSRRWAKVADESPQTIGLDSRRLVAGCFKSSWVSSWLRLALRMPVKFQFQFKTLDQIDSKPLDWTFGAMLAQLAGLAQLG